MDDLLDFGTILLVVSAGLVLAIAVRLLAARVGIPTAGLLLVVAAVASDLVDRLSTILSFQDVQRVATLALVVILFEGGSKIGLRRFRGSAAPILALGIVGTFATAGLLALAVHVLLDLSWTASSLVGAALAPTDPAVTFSVLAGKEVEGRSGTILEGESGFNDPVGIALMIGMIELATHDDASWLSVVWEFLREMGVGLAVGVAGGVAIAAVIRWAPFPDRTLYPVAVILMVGTIYGAATVAHGSGFLAVFVAGILVGDIRFEARRAVRAFNAALGELGELATFVALGLTIDLAFIGDEGLWWRGLVIAVLLGFVVRPLVVGPLLSVMDLTRGERGFVVWSGLKGAVPILLASLAVVAGTEYAAETYGLVFVVVLFSVVVQGSLVPTVARRLGVPLEDAPPPAPSPQ
ncbi:cation:proton antiporter [Gaiella sp.]|uniref:cation:proton antiporter domain-containing protein n=1 Tax=Gaiella sp. TaxID=2663207 RepID=UPI002E338A1E|nr:cation:proton antiporter [Gaiella sp.]HEX5583746.1 cation:proton antiporter [Gaiella sp.]